MHLLLQRPFGLHDQPGAPQQGVGNDQPHPTEQAERGQPVEGATGKMAVDHLEAFEEGAQGHALEEGGDQ
ncbi:hypothetical protein D3C76_1151840 [compost metagenome]